MRLIEGRAGKSVRKPGISGELSFPKEYGCYSLIDEFVLIGVSWKVHRVERIDCLTSEGGQGDFWN